MIRRKPTKEVKIGNLTIGGYNPIRVQSMTITKTTNVEETVEQIVELENAGCEIVRVTASTMKDAKILGLIKKQIHIPLIVDIHFQYQFALEAIKQGVDKVRINPGNIGGKEHIKEVVLACKEKNIPIRIGINSGSLEKDLFSEFGYKGIPFVMVKSAERNIKLLEKLDFKNIIVSLKGSDVQTTIEAYELFSQRFDYPTHVGITEAGTLWNGAIKSSVGIGSILSRGIGDTIRVSLSADPVEEVKAGWQILKSLGLRQKGVNFIACPTCGRTEIDLIGLANKVENALRDIKAPITVAVMGCVVNGPGEASFADIGICGGKEQAAIFRGNKVIATVPEKEAFTRFMGEIKQLLIEKGHNGDVNKLIIDS